MGISPLISAHELSGVLDQSNVKVFDVRGTWSSPARALYEDYLKGHIPGASFIDWTKDFLEQGTAINLAAVADREAATQSFKTLGINKDDRVVLYDDYHHMQAGRIWWAMRYWGFSNVRVLNGGWKYWVSQGYAVSQDIPQITEGSFEPKCQEDLRVSTDDLVSEMGRACLIDARGPIGYIGKPDDPRTGHIPGAFHVPFSAMLDTDTGLFLSLDQIERVFDQSAANWRDGKIISSCGSGYAGTVIMLALEQLGVASTLYDGSFAEWKQNPSRAVEQA